MLSVLLIALLADPSAAPLDQTSLRQAMVEAGEAPSPARLAGQRFRIVLPFTEERVRKYRAFKQSARWTYDARRKVLVTSIGLGEITAGNFSRFESRKLDRLPPLQSLVFNVESRSRPTPFSRISQAREFSYDVGVSTMASSYGLAVPYQEGGVSGLPAGFTPLVINQLRASKDTAWRLAKTMNVVVEGEITSLGQEPEVFCGDYRGQMTSLERSGNTRFVVKDRQCFVTARIDRIRVMRGEGVLAQWPKAAAEP